MEVVKLTFIVAYVLVVASFTVVALLSMRDGGDKNADS